MKTLATLDTLFVSLDTARWPLHGGGIFVLDPSTAPAELTFDVFTSHVRRELPVLTPLRRRLVRTPFGLAEPVWVEDPDFNLDRHVHRIAVPAPGGSTELRHLVAKLGDTPLDGSRPLWDMWFIEGLQHGRVAVFFKMHHAYTDGMGGLKMLSHLMTDSAESPPEAPRDRWKPDRVPTGAEMLVRAVPKIITQPLRATRAITGLARAVIPGRLAALLRPTVEDGPSERATGAPFDCPRVSISEVSPGQIRRSMGWIQAPMSDIQQVREAFDVTFNDVCLAMVTGSLRSYLSDRGELPTSPLTAVNPVNMRDESDSTEVENKFSLLVPLLPTQIADPVERLRTITSGMGRAKTSLKRAGTNPVENIFDIVTPGAVELAVGVLSSNMAPDIPPVFNMCLTNIAGARQPQFICGAEVEEFYIMMMQALGIGPVCAVVTYAGIANFSFTTNGDLVPDAQELADGLRNELQILLGRCRRPLEHRVIGRRGRVD